MGIEPSMFIDTNVLVYSRAVEAPYHNVAGGILERALRSPEQLRIGRQIVREYLAVVTRPQGWSDPLTPIEATNDVNRMLGVFEILEDGPQVTNRLLTLLREIPVGGRQIHDANIVATMLAHGERRLLIFNAADFRRYGDRIEVLEL